MTTRKKPAKDKFIETAHGLFAARGFYGVSLSDLAAELGLTKQAAIYHFKTKDALYGQVLSKLSERFEAILDDVLAADCADDKKWILFVEKLYAHMEKSPDDARLIMRELLDNNERAKESHRWYLRRFLNESVALLGRTSEWKHKSEDEQTAAVYQMVGAINYFGVSSETLSAIWSKNRVKGLKAAFLAALLK